jgi:hypothetical protein
MRIVIRTAINTPMAVLLTAIGTPIRIRTPALLTTISTQVSTADIHIATSRSNQ